MEPLSKRVLKAKFYSSITGQMIDEWGEEIAQLEKAAISLLAMIDCLGGRGALDGAGTDRKNLAKLINYPAVLEASNEP